MYSGVFQPHSHCPWEKAQIYHNADHYKAVTEKE